MMRLLRNVAVAVSVLAGTAVHAEGDTLRIATGEYAPFADSGHPAGGLVNAFVAEIGEDAGYAVDFDYMPWMRSLELARTGRYAATSYWYFNQDREADFIHVGPVLTERMVLFRRVDTELPSWEDISDLNEFSIGAVTGYTYTPDFWDLAADGQLLVETAQDDAANLRKLLAGRIDIYPMSEEVGLALLEKIFTQEERAQITIEPVALMITEGFLLVSRAAENAEDVANSLQAAIDRSGQSARRANE